MKWLIGLFTVSLIAAGFAADRAATLAKWLAVLTATALITYLTWWYLTNAA